MAAVASSDEILPSCLSEKSSRGETLNNNFERKENCKVLLKVCPERELDKYLLEKKNKKVDVQRKTFKPSACQVLRQVKDFLPIMKQAQEELSSTDHNIEDVDDNGPCINMDIQLVQLDDTSSESESDCSDEDTDSDINIGEVTENNLMLKKPEKVKKPLIEDIT